MNTQVTLVRCSGYEAPEVRGALRKTLELLGGLERIIRPGSRVFVKINHLSPSSAPERAILTHPIFTREVVRLLRELDCVVTVGDDIQDDDRSGFSLSGYRDLCRETGARLINVKEEGFVEIPCPGGEVLDKVRFSRAALEAEAVVNLPKLKTHAFTGFTGAVKNVYGLVPLGDRLRYHRQFPRIDQFSRMLLDVFCCLPRGLTIMDGIVGMEGLGPASGTPRALGMVLAGCDAVALDTVSCAAVGIRPDDILTTRFARERGLGAGRLADIDILGETLAAVRVRDFKSPTVVLGALRRRSSSSIYAFIQSRMGFRPAVDRRRCTGCGECRRICPAGAVSFPDGLSEIVTPRCIQCLCCHEVCRDGAIRLRPTLTRRIVGGLEGLFEMVTPKRARSVEKGREF